MVRPNILDQWQISSAELAEIIAANPSMRGLVFGYVAEFKLRKMWFSGKAVENATKYDDHDRGRKSDLVFRYKDCEITVESKSLQTASILPTLEGFRGKFQCDASDRRAVTLPDGSTLETTCLVVGQFDLLAVNLFAFENKWRFVFARNQDLPRSTFKKYTPTQRQSLLATLVTVTWPSQAPFEEEPFRLLDVIAKEKSR
jgi:hypothetical protein